MPRPRPSSSHRAQGYGQRLRVRVIWLGSIRLGRLSADMRTGKMSDGEPAPTRPLACRFVNASGADHMDMPLVQPSWHVWDRIHAVVAGIGRLAIGGPCHIIPHDERHQTLEGDFQWADLGGLEIRTALRGLLRAVDLQEQSPGPISWRLSWGTRPRFLRQQYGL